MAFNITPANYVYSTLPVCVLTFTVPEILSPGDMVKLTLSGFTTLRGVNYVSHVLPSLPYFNLTWYEGTQDLYLYLIHNHTALQYTVNLTHYLPLVLPPNGVNMDTITVGYHSHLNGHVAATTLSSVTHICGLYASSVVYLNPIPGQVSPVTLSFRPSSFDLMMGESNSSATL